MTEPFVLKDDVELIPCSALSDDVRRRIACDEGDYALQHRYGRDYVQVIDGGTAALLQLFRRPRTIADAVLENSRALGKAPHARLDELLPHLDVFLDRGVLVPAGSGRETVRPRYDGGTAVAGWTLVRCVHLFDDTEIYEARRGEDLAALKIARADTPDVRALFDNEEAILRRLDGCGVTPALRGSGVHDGLPYLILEWIDGADASAAAAQRRNDRPALLALCASIADAYAALHARGVLHGDVHALNIVAGERVVLLDFGAGRIAADPPRVDRRGLPELFEPEHAAARRRGGVLPSSEAGEQHAVAALLYQLLTGQHYLDLSYERDEMLRQIECDPMLPFAARGIAPWPEVEEILGRALQKDPSRRYGSMAELAALLNQRCACLA